MNNLKSCVMQPRIETDEVKNSSYNLVIANSIGFFPSQGYLIHSPSRWSEIVSNPERHFSYYPFFLSYLSSILKKETQLKIKMVDGCLEKLNYEQYFLKIKQLHPEFLFMDPGSLVFDQNIELAKAIKKECGTTILFGGPHASTFSEDTLIRGIDFVFCGTYENSVLSFFQEKKYLTDQRIFYPLDVIKFDKFPFPEDSDISRLNYAIPGEPSSNYKEIQIYATRGCNGFCPFCIAKNTFYKKQSHISRKVTDVIAEMKYLKQKYPEIEGFFFDEEDHFGNINFIKEFIRELIQNNNVLKIEALGRIDNIPLEILPLLKKAGYYKLRVGIESFHKDIQESIHKMIDPEKTEVFLQECRKLNIDVYMTFQVGLPESTSKKDNFTLRIIKKFLKKSLLTNVQVSIFTPLPGTPFYKTLQKKGYLISDDFKEYNGGAKVVVNYPDYSTQEIQTTYFKFIYERDHIQLFQQLKTLKIIPFFFAKYKKYSFLSIFKKILRRIFNETRYLIAKT